MKILVTGSQGFLGKNLCVRIRELKKHEVLEYHRQSTIDDLKNLVAQADIVFHLAGVNRPKNELEFWTGNVDLTKVLIDLLKSSGKSVPVIYTSSIQADKNSPYGESKKSAEEILVSLQDANPVHIYRLPNVFGKWSRPNYNSAVATFCHNIARGLPISINDPQAVVNLVYVDDVVSEFMTYLEPGASNVLYPEVRPVYSITVGQLVEQIEAFKDSRSNLVVENVGEGFVRALHATYLSFLSPEQFSYSLPKYGDNRGTFVEMLKTKSAGQFSFFTAHPGITRGGHYHHTKTEKFLILQGKARYRFRHIVTRDFYELDVDGSDAKVVETIPGWSHDITNIGETELIVMLWANEIFDRAKPDTVAHEV